MAKPTYDELAELVVVQAELIKSLTCRLPRYMARFCQVICPCDREAITAPQPLDQHRWCRRCRPSRTGVGDRGHLAWR